MLLAPPPPESTDVCRSRFMKAVRSENVGELQKRVRAGIDVNFRDKPSRKTPLLVAIGTGNEEVVKLLLDANADLTLRDVQLNNGLHIAVTQPNTAITTLLIKAGCPLEECDCAGNTMLLKASRYLESHVHIPVLLAYGCRPDAASFERGRTPLHFAVEQKCTLEVAQKLLVSFDPFLS